MNKLQLKQAVPRHFKGSSAPLNLFTTKEKNPGLWVMGLDTWVLRSLESRLTTLLPESVQD